jgi:TnpA family transposase
MHLLGFRFAPRIRDLPRSVCSCRLGPAAIRRSKSSSATRLTPSAFARIGNETLRLVTSIKHGTLTASLMLLKLSSYLRQNGLAVALRNRPDCAHALHLGLAAERRATPRRVHAGLNKAEATNALARAVFFNRLGEVRDRSFEHQRYGASGLNLVVAAIVLWNTVYLERAVQALADGGQTTTRRCCASPFTRVIVEHLPQRAARNRTLCSAKASNITSHHGNCRSMVLNSHGPLVDRVK